MFCTHLNNELNIQTVGLCLENKSVSIICLRRVNSLQTETEVWDGEKERWRCLPSLFITAKVKEEKILPRKRQKRSRRTRIFLWLLSFPSLLGFMLSEAITFSHSNRCIECNSVSCVLPRKYTNVHSSGFRLLSARIQAEI